VSNGARWYGSWAVACVVGAGVVALVSAGCAAAVSAGAGAAAVVCPLSGAVTVSVRGWGADEVRGFGVLRGAGLAAAFDAVSRRAGVVSGLVAAVSRAGGGAVSDGWAAPVGPPATAPVSGTVWVVSAGAAPDRCSPPQPSIPTTSKKLDVELSRPRRVMFGHPFVVKSGRASEPRLPLLSEC